MHTREWTHVIHKCQIHESLRFALLSGVSKAPQPMLADQAGSGCVCVECVCVFIIMAATTKHHNALGTRPADRGFSYSS